ncbi:hypothetical protein GCM10011600_14690 [Pseudolysinimonas yzui]|uniref:Uncharacterized protein n=1 Tax=Pseudolysinimonas yzui TaxID=2708254 RepID=A0A8J3LZX5_9MICO|nr:hypothetical protein GCM10011600_14690 [Pseudolysinimonas yzui]
MRAAATGETIAEDAALGSRIRERSTEVRSDSDRRQADKAVEERNTLLRISELKRGVARNALDSYR